MNTNTNFTIPKQIVDDSSSDDLNLEDLDEVDAAALLEDLDLNQEEEIEESD